MARNHRKSSSNQRSDWGQARIYVYVYISSFFGCVISSTLVVRFVSSTSSMLFYNNEKTSDVVGPHWAGSHRMVACHPSRRRQAEDEPTERGKREWRMDRRAFSNKQQLRNTKELEERSRRGKATVGQMKPATKASTSTSTTVIIAEGTTLLF